MALTDEHTGLELLYRGKDISLYPFKDIVQYNANCNELELLPLTDKELVSKEFNIPQHYKELDVEEYIRSLIPQQSSAEIHGLPVNPAARVEEESALIPASGQDDNIITARVEMELAEYKARNLYPILQLLIYIIDTMRKNELIWGVGRGSSVASYVLYLLGVHKVDSIKYNLDIKEFLK